MSNLAYRVRNGLYLNVTNLCSNTCSFCIRNGHETVGNSDCLWLSAEPSEEELWSSLNAEMFPEAVEIVFCGYGEPMMRLDLVLALCRRIRANYTLPIRINTNGQADLIAGKRTAPLLKGLVDVISVSLNAPNAVRYQEICSPAYPDAFEALLSFALDCRKFVPKVYFSVVDQPLHPEEIDDCQKLAAKLEIPLRVRTFE